MKIFKTRKKNLLILAVLSCFYIVIQLLTLNQPYAEYLPLIFISFFPLVFVSCKNNQINLLEPSLILLAFCIYGGFIRVLSISVSSDSTIHLFQLSGSNSLLSGCLLFILFNFIFACGYSMAPKLKNSSILNIKIPKALSYFLLGGLIIIGCYLIHNFFTEFGVYSLISSGNISSKKLVNVNDQATSASYLRLGETLFLSLFIVSYYKFKLGAQKLLPLIVISGLLVILFSIVVSSRSGVLTIFIAFLSIRSYFERKIISPRIIASILCVLLIFSFITNSRQSSKDTDFNLQESTTLLFEQLSKPQYSYTIDKAVMATQMVPTETPYLYGRSLTSPLLAPIPRSAWPDKPLIRYGPEFASNVLLDTRENTGVPPSYPVELYWNFGWPGLILGSFFIGALSGDMNRKMNHSLTRISRHEGNRKNSSISKHKSSNHASKKSSLRNRYSITPTHIEAINYTIFILFFVRLFRADFSAAVISCISMTFFITLFFSVFNQQKA